MESRLVLGRSTSRSLPGSELIVHGVAELKVQW